MQPDVVTHTWNPRAREPEAEGLQAPEQAGQAGKGRKKSEVRDQNRRFQHQQANEGGGGCKHLFHFVFKTGRHLAQDSLKHTVWLRLALNSSSSSCLYLK